MHRSGFVNIIGKPNAGKSTLMNALVGERMSIITHKPQTTRHRIIGILSGDDFQVVFSDTPGIIDDPAYRMQEAMNSFIAGTFDDADLMLLVVDCTDPYKEKDPIFEKLSSLKAPLFLVLNKTDLIEKEKVLEQLQWWNDRLEFREIIPISALKKENTERLRKLILQQLPEGPVYYPKDQLTDRPERFFVSEIIREKILELYEQEVPYSVEVVIEAFKEDTTKAGEPLIRILAHIFVNRKTQKAILIGKGGRAIKRLGTEARKSLETWLESKVFLELFVKVRENWRDDESALKRFGY
jgi:GTP-binding protein Era